MISEATDQLRERMVKGLLDLIIMAKTSEQGITGYEITQSLHKELDCSISPGTVYHVLYSIERMGLIKKTEENGKKTYKLTIEGREVLKEVIRSSECIIQLLNTTIN